MVLNKKKSLKVNNIHQFTCKNIYFCPTLFEQELFDRKITLHSSKTSDSLKTKNLVVTSKHIGTDSQTGLSLSQKTPYRFEWCIALICMIKNHRVIQALFGLIRKICHKMRIRVCRPQKKPVEVKSRSRRIDDV